MSRVPVLTAVPDAVWEADLVAALDRSDLGVAVVRRCVDVADLLAAAATGQARAVLLSGDLRRLDREVLARLAVAGVAVVGVSSPDDEDAERRLRQLGVAAVVPADADPEALAAAVLDAVLAPADPGHGLADPARALPDVPLVVPGESVLDDDVPLSDGGRVVAVWGPTGAPGRTTVAIGLASETALLGRSTVLVDADVYGGVIAPALGILDEAPGLAAAARQANAGALTRPGLADLARQLAPNFRVLTGIARADRWPELRWAAVEAVLEQARTLAELTVVDCGFGLEQDEELAYDTLAPRRNGATLSVLAAADTVVAVGTADPLGLQRLVRALAELQEAVPGVQPVVVVNRVRASAIPGDAGAEIRAALQRYAGVPDVVLVPHDVPALDAAVAAGRTLAEAAPQSPARLALASLAASLAGVSRRSRPRRRLLARR